MRFYGSSKVFGKFRGPIAALAAAAAVTAMIGATAHANTGVTSAPTTAALARLKAIAHNMGSVNGDSHPVTVVAVETTGRRALAAATPGGTEPGVARVPVYVIAMTGNFKGYGFRHPGGSPVPTGRFLDIVINAKTFWVMAMSLRSERTQVGSLGRAFSLR